MSGIASKWGNEHYAFVDYAKGLCIIGVVMMYSTISVGLDMEGEGFLHPIVEFARPFRIPAFFFLTGMFLCRVQNNEFGKFLDKKIIHFVYFYCLWTIIHFLVGSIDLLVREDYSVLCDLILAPIQPFSTLWFIYLLPLFFLASRFFRNLPAPLVFVAAALLETARIQTGWLVIDNFAGKWVFFVAGAMLAPAVIAVNRRVVAQPARTACAILAFTLIDAVLTGVVLPNGMRPSTLPVVSIVLGLTGAVAVIAVAALLERFGVAGWIAYCGQQSMPIYLGFFLPMTAFRGMLVDSALIADIGIASVFVTIAGVGGALLIERAARSTSLNVLFRRPVWFKVTFPQTTRYSLALRANLTFQALQQAQMNTLSLRDRGQAPPIATLT